MKNIDNDVAFVINIHERLVRDFPDTPYIIWCRWVHAQSLAPRAKLERILSWVISPTEYQNPTLFRYDWQAFKLLSKFCSGGTPSQADKDAAYRKFLMSEERCGILNRQWADSIPPGICGILHNAKNIIANVLGPVDNFFNWNNYSSSNRPQFFIDRFSGRTGTDQYDFRNYTNPGCMPSFGPGISVGHRGKLSTTSEKIVLGTVVPRSASMVELVTGEWKEVLQRPFGVRGSVLTFVPKRVGEARTICYEPSMNMLAQKRIGLYLKSRLKAKIGIDLSNQERNRSLAELGSLCGSYATLDLSAASDLNSYMLVMNLLPFDWFHLLDGLRCDQYFDPVVKDWKSFEKFSTMGNGFTFELETLIFAAIVKATIDEVRGNKIPWREVSAYGDDLIFPQQYYHRVCQALTVCGHIPNESKSFATGPFRESCGGDFFKGWDVTPAKIEELNLNDPRTVVNAYNRLLISARQDINLSSFSDRFGRALGFIKGWLLRNYPRVSEGPIEWEKFSYTLRRFRYQPSNRFLWNPKPQVNCAWSTHLQAIVPKYLLIGGPRTKMFGQKWDQSCIYDISQDVLLYHIHKGVGPRELTHEKISWRRNLDLYRCRPKKTAPAIATPGLFNTL